MSQDTDIQEQLLQRIATRDNVSPRVIDAMRSVPRELFFPEEMRRQAHEDSAAPIGHGQTISQPTIVAMMTDHLDVRESHRVLEIGTGSGYQTAILSRLAAEVYSIERIKPLLDQAFERLMALGCRNVHLKHGDGTLGWPEAAPFDRILITAGAPRMPEHLLQGQLADGGVAVLPVGPMEDQTLVRLVREGDNLRSSDICRCRFVKLVGEEGWRMEEK